MQRILVLGAGGFIGGHLVTRLKSEGHWVCGVDIKPPPFGASAADAFILGDLRDIGVCNTVVGGGFDEVYQLAADMGGAGFVFSGENDAGILHNSAMINLNIADTCQRRGAARLFYASSACIYPARNQTDPANPMCAEASAYPADPDSDYGWEKLFGERVYAAYARNHGLTVRIARYHNIFGPLGAWTGGREKAPAAVCRKVALAEDGAAVEIWGDGEQTRSFLYIDECLEGTLRLMRSDVAEPLNIGSEEMISINGLVDLVAGIAGKRVVKRHVPGPLGVRGRNSDNQLIRQRLGWSPAAPLRDGMARTLAWVAAQLAA